MNRRSFFASFVVAGAALPVAAARGETPKRSIATKVAAAQDFGLAPNSSADQTTALQAAVDQAAEKGVALMLPSGRYRAAGIALRPGSHVVGSAGTVIDARPDRPAFVGEGAHRARLERLTVDVSQGAEAGSQPDGIVEFHSSRSITIDGLTLAGGAKYGLHLVRSSGSIAGTHISRAAAAGIMSIDAEGLEIVGNTVRDCADNGILVWRSVAGEDGTLVAQNRIERIGAASGGSGQYGNGINVFRAAGVRVTANRIVDCAYSAVRGNAASNIQIVANSVERIGEVALYAEFGFEGALISQNIVDGAASGISVTNFNEGGRLAVIQGNLVRNLHRREFEPADKRGEGIAVEADASVTGNTVEGAPTAGIVIGWGRHMRDVAATGNVVRGSRIGIMITRDPAAGTCLVAHNLISGARSGAIRLAEHGVPVGEDLVRSPPRSERLVITGNVATVAAL